MVDRIKTSDITLQLPDVKLRAFLSSVENPRGAVLFAHGSGSSRHSPRNQYMAKVFQNVGFNTLLMDLLTPDEEKTDLIDRKHRFNIPLLGKEFYKKTYLEKLTGKRPKKLDLMAKMLVYAQEPFFMLSGASDPFLKP